MTTPTVPQDVYQRHEREWQMLREAIAKSQELSEKAEKKPAEIKAVADTYRWPPIQMHQ
ncbi:hypothetical protein SAMN04515648_0239 [Phyllobacterium sp. CL33Tsu]|uniref:hypothetical protein n=1 Tax=Phyllobacterium sp. CL33Tsu TaxID=1798191 RepID=UPI0008EF3C99|nr:hypothetical protein [Phyllobacterium sp. CL33Tsu]SFI51142.1 hypothetical protein SAMN04515648_0239 [Phyllobacterium sp. CL33Tsu]